ncbi:MAG TPA: hypothetical protein VHE59_00285 [Mucilaginibacter sp.]|nr:hypothetical protein [Mucilaginibacter sp.]
MANLFAFLSMEKEINSYPSLNEKLAFINGYLSSIAILNSTANNGMEHWMIDLGSIDENVANTIKKGINAPNWTFKATEIKNWREVIEDELFFFFSNILHEIQGSKEYYNNTERRYDLTEKYNLKAQLGYFIKMLTDLFSHCQLKAVYNVEVDFSAEWYNPYFAHGESNFAFEIESNQLLYLHLGAFD